MTNTELADELMAKLPKWISSGGPGTWYETLTGAQWEQIIAALSARSDGFREGIMAAAKVCDAYLWAPVCAAAIRSLSPRETDDGYANAHPRELDAAAASAPSGEVAEMMAGTIPTDAPDRWEVSIHIGDDGDWHLRHRKSQTGQWVTFEEHQKVIASLRRPESTKGVADISGMQQKPRVLNKNER